MLFSIKLYLSIKKIWTYFLKINTIDLGFFVNFKDTSIARLISNGGFNKTQNIQSKDLTT
jgi:hypothetical protein